MASISHDVLLLFSISVGVTQNFEHYQQLPDHTLKQSISPRLLPLNYITQHFDHQSDISCQIETEKPLCNIKKSSFLICNLPYTF